MLLESPVRIGDVLEFSQPGHYPSVRVVAIAHNAIAFERMDGVIEPLQWYSIAYVNTLLQGDWKKVGIGG